VVQQQVSVCRRCDALCRTRTNTVFGSGPVGAEVMFVGEAPGADEDRTGEAFQGPAGQVFNRLLAEIGLSRDSVYVTNLLKCQPPGNRKPTPQESHNCRDYLVKQIELVKPRSIVALGATAAQGLLGSTESIGRLRGRLYDYQGIPVLCTYHPAYLLPGRAPERSGDVVNDLKLVLRRLGRVMRVRLGFGAGRGYHEPRVGRTPGCPRRRRTMKTMNHPLLGCLLAGMMLAPADALAQPAGKPALPKISYGELGKLVRGLKGKVVVVYFWAEF
jgi:DNA polymerase